jgi:PAS domain S-box-containing protein
MFAVVTILHYVVEYGTPSTETTDLQFGLTRHAIDRILFLLPVAYASYVFRLRWGMVALAVAAVAMLPRAIFVSHQPTNALVETGAVILVGGLVNLAFEKYRRETESRQQTTSQLEAAQKELQSYAQALSSREKWLAAINAVFSSASQSLELQEVLNRATDKVMEVMEVDVAMVYLLDREAQELELHFYRGVSKEFAAGVDRLKIGEGFNGRVAQTGEPLLVADASTDPRLTREAVKQEGLQAQVIVPLQSKGEVVGTLGVAVRRPRQFSAEEVELLAAIGHEIGISLENARLYQQERLIAEQLRVSERNYRGLFEGANDAIWVHDLEGNVISANNATEGVTGYTVEELTRMNVASFLDDRGFDVAKKVRESLLQGEPLEQPYEQRVIKRDGAQAILRLTSSLVTTDGQPTGFQHIARDVTLERRMEDNLRFYVQQITQAQEEERKRIARELHDDTAQELIALSRRLDNIISTSTQLSKRDSMRVEEARQQLDSILKGVRRFSQDLRPSVLDDLGLLPALEWLTSELQRHFGIAIGTAVIGVQRRFSPEAELLMFRIAQEALRNACKHAQASRAWVTVEFGDDKIILTVTDNGKGFELPKRLSDLASSGKLGLAGMEERARLLGGSLTLHSEPGKGTTVTVEVPL